MKKTLRFAIPVAALATLISVSAFADSRHRDETWRDRRDDRYERRDDRRDHRRDDRDFLRGTIVRIDRRNEVILLRESRTGRVIRVDMDRTDRRDRRGRVEFDELRRGDFVRLDGEWRRGGTFEAYRIAGVR